MCLFMKFACLPAIDFSTIVRDDRSPDHRRTEAGASGPAAGRPPTSVGARRQQTVDDPDIALSKKTYSVKKPIRDLKQCFLSRWATAKQALIAYASL